MGSEIGGLQHLEHSGAADNLSQMLCCFVQLGDVLEAGLVTEDIYARPRPVVDSADLHHLKLSGSQILWVNCLRVFQGEPWCCSNAVDWDAAALDSQKMQQPSRIGRIGSFKV